MMVLLEIFRTNLFVLRILYYVLEKVDVAAESRCTVQFMVPKPGDVVIKCRQGSPLNTVHITAKKNTGNNRK